MGSTDPSIAILPIKLGTAAAYNRNIFPLAYVEHGGDNLAKGSFLIRATLDEMENIKELGVDLNKNGDFIFNTRLEVEMLKEQEENLQKKRKTLNPFKAFLNYRAARLFHESSRALFIETKRTSEKIQREGVRMQVVPSARLQMVDNAPGEAELFGWAVELPNGMNDSARKTIEDVTAIITKTNPFNDNPLISQLREDEQAITLADTASLLSLDVHAAPVDEGNQASSDIYRPTSPQTVNVHCYLFENSIFAPNSSNPSGFTTNQGDRNSGASVTQQSAS